MTVTAGSSCNKHPVGYAENCSLPHPAGHFEERDALIAEAFAGSLMLFALTSSDMAEMSPSLFLWRNNGGVMK